MPTILITGANRGIGLELTRCYASRGDTVIACCRSPQHADDLRRIKEQANDSVIIHELDVTDDISIAALKTSLGSMAIDVLINNAGVISPKNQSTWEMDFDGFLNTLNVNTLSPLRMLQAFMDPLKASTAPKAITIANKYFSFIHSPFISGSYPTFVITSYLYPKNDVSKPLLHVPQPKP